MIKTIHQLLTEIKNKGIEEIEPFLNIEHGPMIGDMYEGLTKEIVEKSLFDGMDLRVVSGKITNQVDGKLSSQIDCMVVIGDGTKIPYSENYLYDIDQVIMVIEVKKNLYSNELSEGYDNLRSVINVQRPTRDLRLAPIEDAFRAISGKPLPDVDQISSLAIKDQMLYHSLVVEALLPLRVIFGYGGFKTEHTLRNKFVEYMERKWAADGGSARGYGAASLPNLVVAGDCALIKTNGMPYALVVEGLDEYCWIASYRRNPLILFLELLWTRLTYFYNLSTRIFGDELQEEALIPLLTAQGTEKGWLYRVMPYSERNRKPLDHDREWSPTVLSETENILMNILCRRDYVEIKELKKNLLETGENVENIINHLTNERLIYVDDEKIRLLTKECKCMIVPGVGFVAADDHDGRLMRWVMKQMAKSRNKPEGI